MNQMNENELGMSVFSTKNRGETGIFAEGDVEIKDTGQQN